MNSEGFQQTDGSNRKPPCLYPLPDGRRCCECDACQGLTLQTYASRHGGIPARHPATQAAWDWLQSRTVQELPPEKRDEIAEKLMDIDAELWGWDD